MAGVYDRPYLEDRLRVGLAIRQGACPQAGTWGLTAATSPNCCHALPGYGAAQTEELMHTFQALIKVVFLDVGLAIDSYIAHRDDLIADLRDYGAAFANPALRHDGGHVRSEGGVCQPGV